MEEPLPSGGSCLLGSINLAEFVTEYETFDFVGFKDTVKKAVVALNEVLDEGLPLHPLIEQRESVLNTEVKNLLNGLIWLEPKWSFQL